MANDIRRLRQQSIMGGYDNLTPELNQDYMSMSAPSYESEDGPWNSAPPSYVDPRDQGNEPWYGGQGGIGNTIAPQASSGQAGMGAPKPYNPQETLDLVNKAFTPDFTDRDRLRKLMDAAPERQAPSFARALVAGALSQKAADPIATSEAVMYAPHRRNMADWTAKADPFYKTAELENRQNVNERTLTSNVIVADTQARRLEENARATDLKNEVAQEKNRIARLRAEIAGRDDYEVNAKGPTIIVTNKHTGEPRDTGIKTGWMTEADRIEAEGGWGVKRAEAGGAAAIARARASGLGILQDESGKKWRQNPDTGNLEEVEGGPTGPLTKPGTPRASTSTEDTPAEAKTRRQEALRAAYFAHPQYQKHFTINNGIYELSKRPKVGITGDTSKRDSWDQINKIVDPKYVPPEATSAPAPPKGSNLPNPGYFNPPVPKFSGAPTKGAGPSPANTGIQSRAEEFLRKNGKPVTPANIEHVIKTGGVR